ncbi:biopolymer transporter ExbD [Maricaulis sp.]|uniref:ExbD/TolR family protein n=1 Tax=Maricaulis sp. TaxID=1486257 RepID=UPI00263721FA|nr:biopolymer transporter ExbD [Maricaulis sp.]
MGASVDRGGNGRGRTRWKPKAEINVTPFVDVMLVLLIVFMVTAPFLTVGIQVDMPETEARNLPASEEPLTITITAEGVIYLQETEVGFDELIPRLEAIAGAGYDSRVFIRSDGGASWDQIAPVMARISDAGFTRLGLVTNPVDQ